jgi:uncharacterized protein (TIGR03086 family)
MADVLALYLRACDHFNETAHAIKPGDWGRETPCADWDVRALVDHIVVEQLWAPPLLDGLTIAEVGDRFDGDALGDDPVRSWDAAIRDARDAFSANPSLDQTVHLSFGDVPAEEYAWQMTMDLLIHGWDLARGIGADESMDDELVREIHDKMLPMMDDLAASGMFGPPVEADDAASPSVRLLALFGRRA